MEKPAVNLHINNLIGTVYIQNTSEQSLQDLQDSIVSTVLSAVSNLDFEQKDSCNYQMGTMKEDAAKKDEIKPLQQLNEIGDMIRNPQYKQSAELCSGIQQLRHLSEVLRNESTGYPCDLTTSFASAEIQIAKYISECLKDSHEENSDIEKILSLIKDYKVVRLLPEGKHTLSLHKVYLILQDNYPSSSLCGLFNFLLCGRNNGTPKVITFY